MNAFSLRTVKTFSIPMISTLSRNFSVNSNITDEIDKLVKKSKVVLFMKGVPVQPRCGFSNAVVQILRLHGVDYDAHDVLQNDDLREGIKQYSNWPTIPQVFINGEFIGGCDIMMQLHQTGKLIKELEKAGIKSAITATEPPTTEKKSE